MLQILVINLNINKPIKNLEIRKKNEIKLKNC